MATILDALEDGGPPAAGSYAELRATLLGCVGGSMREQAQRLGQSYNAVYSAHQRRTRPSFCESLLLRVWEQMPAAQRLEAAIVGAKIVRAESEADETDDADEAE